MAFEQIKMIKAEEKLCEAKCQREQDSPHLRALCLKECVSPDCYTALYGHDALEPGEVDVRHPSFRACAALRLRKARREG